jgi:hypothetical protein
LVINFTSKLIKMKYTQLSLTLLIIIFSNFFSPVKSMLCIKQVQVELENIKGSLTFCFEEEKSDVLTIYINVPEDEQIRTKEKRDYYDDDGNLKGKVIMDEIKLKNKIADQQDDDNVNFNANVRTLKIFLNNILGVESNNRLFIMPLSSIRQVFFKNYEGYHILFANSPVFLVLKTMTGSVATFAKTLREKALKTYPYHIMSAIACNLERLYIKNLEKIFPPGECCIANEIFLINYNKNENLPKMQSLSLCCVLNYLEYLNTQIFDSNRQSIIHHLQLKDLVGAIKTIRGDNRYDSNQDEYKLKCEYDDAYNEEKDKRQDQEKQNNAIMVIEPDETDNPKNPNSLREPEKFHTSNQLITKFPTKPTITRRKAIKIPKIKIKKDIEENPEKQYLTTREQEYDEAVTDDNLTDNLPRAMTARKANEIEEIPSAKSRRRKKKNKSIEIPDTVTTDVSNKDNYITPIVQQLNEVSTKQQMPEVPAIVSRTRTIVRKHRLKKETTPHLIMKEERMPNTKDEAAAAKKITKASKIIPEQYQWLNEKPNNGKDSTETTEIHKTQITTRKEKVNCREKKKQKPIEKNNLSLETVDNEIESRKEGFNEHKDSKAHKRNHIEENFKLNDNKAIKPKIEYFENLSKSAEKDDSDISKTTTSDKFITPIKIEKVHSVINSGDEPKRMKTKDLIELWTTRDNLSKQKHNNICI